MNSLRTFALLTVVSSLAVAARATTLDPTPLASTTATSSSGTTDSQSSSSEIGGAPAAGSETTAIFTSGQLPIGDGRLAYHPFAITAEGVQEPTQLAVTDEAPSPTPEPAGLLLLGTGAFVTALSIRYRLFAL